MDLVAGFRAAFGRKKADVGKPNQFELVPSASSGLLSKYIDFEENPDEILNRESHGRKYKLYDEMLWKDPHIKSITDTRFGTAASRSWSIVPFDDSDEAKKVALFVELVLNNIPQLSEIFKRLLGGGVWKGFSVAEIIWGISDSGVVTVTDIKDRHQNRFRFSKEGNLQYQVDDTGQKYEDAVPMKFLLLRYNPEAGSSYGTGLARSAYWFYTFKRGAMKQWVISAEKFGAPTVLIRHNDDITPDQKSRLRSKADTIMYGASLTVSKDVEVDLLEAQRRADSPYLPLVTTCNEENSKLILGGTLSSDAGSKGTQALGTVHENVRDDILASDCQLLSYVINSQLVKWIVDFNIANVTGYPTFVMQYEPPKDRKAIVEVVTAAVNIGLGVDKDYLHEELAIPKPDEGAELLTPSAPKMLQADNPDGPDPDATADDKLTLKASVGSVLKLLNDFRSNSLSGMFSTMFAKGKQPEAPPAATTEFVIRENPERFLPNLPPDPKPVEGQPMPVRPNLALERFQLGGIATYQSRLRKKLIDIYGQSVNGWLAEFEQTPRDMAQFIADDMEKKFKGQLRSVISNADREMIRTAAKDIAKKLGEQFNLTVFESLASDYLRVYAYDSGVIEGIANTTKKLFSDKFAAALNSGDDLTAMIEFLKAELPQLTEARATLIAVNELRQAANWTVLEMGKRSRFDLEAWFITDPQSCPICQDVASKNPYSLQQAQSLNLPHINCNDYWTMTKRGPA